MLNPSHGLGRRGEEMAATVPTHFASGRPIAARHQAEVGFMNQSRGLKSLSGRLLGHPLGRQLSQLVIDQRQGCLAALGSSCWI